MKILKNKRYQELLLAEQKAEDLELTLQMMEVAEVLGENIQREWDRTLGRLIHVEYPL